MGLYVDGGSTRPDVVCDDGNWLKKCALASCAIVNEQQICGHLRDDIADLKARLEK